MQLIQMLYYEQCRPGVVGSVGDVIGGVRLKHSAPDLPIRQLNSPNDQNRMGSAVQDGQKKNYWGSTSSHVDYQSAYQTPRRFTAQNFFTYQDVRAPDKRYEPTLSQSFSIYDDQRASIMQATKTGIAFSRLPGSYTPTPGVALRGGNTPRITDITGGDFVPRPDSVVTNRNINFQQSQPLKTLF